MLCLGHSHTLEALSQPVATVDGPGDGPSPPPQSPPPALELFQCHRLLPLPLAHIFSPPLFLTPVLHSRPDTTSASPSPQRQPLDLLCSAYLLPPSNLPSSPAKRARSKSQSTQKESVSIGRVLLLFSFLSTSFPGRSQRTLLFFLVKRLRGRRLCAPIQGSQPGF